MLMGRFGMCGFVWGVVFLFDFFLRGGLGMKGVKKGVGRWRC